MLFSSYSGTPLLQVTATDSDPVNNAVTYSIYYANFNFSIDSGGTIRNLQAFPISDAIKVSRAQ